MVDSMIKNYQTIQYRVDAIEYDGTPEGIALAHAFILDGAGNLTMVEDEDGVTGLYINDGDFVINVNVGDFVVKNAVDAYFALSPEEFHGNYEEI